MLRYHRGSECRKQLPSQGRGTQDVGTVKLRSLEAGPAEATLTTLRRRHCLAGAGVSEGVQRSYFCNWILQQSGFSSCYRKDLPLLGWKSVAGEILMETGRSKSLLPPSSLQPPFHVIHLQSLIGTNWQSRNIVCRVPAQHSKEYRKLGCG